MMNSPHVLFLQIFVGLASVLTAVLNTGHIAAEDAYFDETQTTTLFAFDDVSIPFTQNLKLVMRQPDRHSANPVIARGMDGAVDSWAVQFYGSVRSQP